MTILPDPASARPERRVAAELTNYGGDDDAPRELRVDLVDADQMTTLASLTPDAALSLAASTLDAVIAARHRGQPRVAPPHGEPGA